MVFLKDIFENSLIGNVNMDLLIGQLYRFFGCSRKKHFGCSKEEAVWLFKEEVGAELDAGVLEAPCGHQLGLAPP